MKKIVALVMVCLMLFGVVACNNTTTSNTKKGEITTIKWYNIGKKQADTDLVLAEINKKLAEKYNLKLDLQIIDTGAYSEKMNLVISSGETFDLCFTSNWANPFLKAATGGAFLPIDEYLNTTSKKLKESLPDFVWDDGKVNGKIVTVPNYQVYYYQAALNVPKRLVDKYSFDVSGVKRLADIEPFLKLIKTNEPNIFPVNAIDLMGFYNLDKNYDSIIGVQGVEIDKESLKVSTRYDKPEYVEALQAMSDWYKKGYIRKDVLSSTNSSNDDTRALKYAVWIGSIKPGIDIENKKTYGEEIVQIPLNRPFINAGIGHATMNAVSRTSKNAKAAVKMLEVFNTDKEIYNLIAFGIEGTHYTKLTEKTIKFIDGSKYEPAMAWAYGNQFNAYIKEGQPEDVWEKTDKINRESEKSKLRGFTMNMEPIKNEISKIDAIRKEYSFIEYGAEDFEAMYKEMLDKLEKAGIGIVKQEVEKQINEFIKSK